MRNTLTFIAALLFTTALAAQSSHTTRIEPLRNEKWWGIYVGGTVPQPFSECSGLPVVAHGVDEHTNHDLCGIRSLRRLIGIPE